MEVLVLDHVLTAFPLPRPITIIFSTFLILSQSWPIPLHVAFVKSSRFLLIFNILLSNFMINQGTEETPPCDYPFIRP